MAQAIKNALGTQFARFLQQYRGVRPMCNYSKELTKVQTPADFLFNNLKNANNTKFLLETVAQHGNIMNNKHVIQALRSLYTLQKNGQSELSNREVLTHSEFRNLCYQLRRQSGTIELNDTIEALKVVSYVGAQSTSTIVQVLLQLLKHSVNQLSLHQIIFLDFLISQFKQTPLTEALKIAFPMVFQIQLPLKIEYDNPTHLAEYFFYASRNNISDESIERIAKGLLSFQHDFDAKTAKSIIWSICDLDADETLRPLMNTAIEALMVNADSLNFSDLETTLSKLIGRYSVKADYFYNEVFFDMCANYVVDNDMGFRQSLYILRKFGRVNHSNYFLLDYMAKKVHENPDLIRNASAVDIYGIVVSVALSDYRPPHWEELKKLITQTENLANSDKKEILWLKFGASLCILDIYKLDVLHKVMKESYLHAILKRRYKADYESYAVIYQCITLFKPEMNCLLKDRIKPDELCKKWNYSMDFPLESSLHKGLGGENYVKTQLLSKLGHLIDHVVVFRKGGYPVAMNYPAQIEYIEEVEVPSDHQLVIIQGLGHFDYTLNNNQMRGCTSLNIKVLESNGYVVVPICLQIWNNLPDFEKIPYLMQNIKEKLEIDTRHESGGAI